MREECTTCDCGVVEDVGVKVGSIPTSIPIRGGLKCEPHATPCKFQTHHDALSKKIGLYATLLNPTI